MPNFGRIEFRSARASGILMNQLGSGIADHIKFCGPLGFTSAVEVGSHQDRTFISDLDGNIVPHLGAASGALTNNKFISNNQVKVSGFPTKLLTEVNKFFPSALNTYPNFPHRSSGTLLIRYIASGVSTVSTFNAKIFAFDNTLTIDDAPPDITFLVYEINASGQWFNAAQSGVWKQAHGNQDPHFFTNHSSINGWIPKNQHIWVCGISVKPNTIGVLDQWDIGFGLQFN